MSDADPSPSSSNRRTGDRHLACAMASIQRPDGEQRPALVHDLSESGTLLLVRTTKVAVDDELSLHLPANEDDETPRVVSGLVVRVEELGPGHAGPWLRRVAMRFHEPLQMYPGEIEGFRRRVERLGIAQ